MGSLPRVRDDGLDLLLMGTPVFSIGPPLFSYWIPFILLWGSPLVSDGHPFILRWVPPAFLMDPLIRLLVSPLFSSSLSIGVLLVSDGNLPIRNQMRTTWKAQECPIAE